MSHSDTKLIFRWCRAEVFYIENVCQIHSLVSTHTQGHHALCLSVWGNTRDFGTVDILGKTRWSNLVVVCLFIGVVKLSHRAFEFRSWPDIYIYFFFQNNQAYITMHFCMEKSFDILIMGPFVPQVKMSYEIQMAWKWMMTEATANDLWKVWFSGNSQI